MTNTSTCVATFFSRHTDNLYHTHSSDYLTLLRIGLTDGHNDVKYTQQLHCV